MYRSYSQFSFSSEILIKMCLYLNLIADIAKKLIFKLIYEENKIITFEPSDYKILEYT